MNIQSKHRLTFAEFLEWAEKQQRGRFELVDGEIVEMSPETLRHIQVKHRCAKALESAVQQAGVDCTVFADGATVKIDRDNSREPDATIQCGAYDPDSVAVDNPLVVVEVTSPSSVRSDAATKLVDYFKVSSIVHYLIVDPIRRSAVLHSRLPDEERISTRIFSVGMIDFSPPGISVAIEDLLGPAEDARPPE